MTTLAAAGAGQIDAAGSIDFTSATSSYEAPMQSYFVVFDDGKMFISGEVTAPYNALTFGSVTFTAAEVDDAWTGDYYDAAEGFSAAGWYGASTSPEPTPTPEPTSGLLMLVGLAGLALRRKQA